ncbi:MAG: autotransporter-associated beta strand repeat-containing protein [Planctomycetales bacterium]|nr:autotransporter-associated beta strand repeat-containing protein [Planctomycetales bacterium]
MSLLSIWSDRLALMSGFHNGYMTGAWQWDHMSKAVCSGEVSRSFILIVTANHIRSELKRRFIFAQRTLFTFLRSRAFMRRNLVVRGSRCAYTLRGRGAVHLTRAGTVRLEEAAIVFLFVGHLRRALFRRARRLVLSPCMIAWGCLILLSAASQTVAQTRVLGLDISAWQGNISQTTWNNIHNVEGRDFVFLRSSRGGTTGYYNQSDPNNNNGLNTLSQRYDDPYFVQNITRATSAGMFAGTYHFSRPDIIETTQNSGGIANTGTDEANHFIEMAGAWMRPGYLLPVHDLEAGDGIRSDNEMAQFSIDFSDRIYEVMGIRPAIYTNGNYAAFVIGGASSSLQDQVVAAYPTLWSARWPNQSNPDAIPVQTGHPKDSYSQIYGPWDDPPNPTHPWAFWQYASTGRLQSYNNGNSNLDFNVAQGGTEFLKDHLVPALWTTDSDGDWNTLANWNSGQAPIAPVQGPGQVPRVGPLTLPSVRLPSSNDTVILDRPGASVAVTLSSGVHNIRKLVVREELNITGGSLIVNYVPAADSTPYSAQFSAPVSMSNASLSVHTLQVDAGQDFSLTGVLTFDTIELMPHSTTPAKMTMQGFTLFNSLSGTASIVNGAGTGSSGLIDLNGATQAWNVPDGAPVVDVSVEVPMTNGGLTKAGAGTLALEGANTYTGDTSVLDGSLIIGTPFLADSSDVYLTTGAEINLDFGGGPDVIDSLFIDGISQAAGIWGAVGSGAQFTSPLITGSGLLQVATFVPDPPGNFDGDDDVDGFDFLMWQRGESPTPLGGSDLTDWEDYFGTPAPPLAGTRAVPEPSTWFLLLIGLLAVGRSAAKSS